MHHASVAWRRRLDGVQKLDFNFQDDNFILITPFFPLVAKSFLFIYLFVYCRRHLPETFYDFLSR